MTTILEFLHQKSRKHNLVDILSIIILLIILSKNALKCMVMQSNLNNFLLVIIALQNKSNYYLFIFYY